MSITDVIHTVLGVGAIAGGTVLCAMGKLDAASTVTLYMAVLGVSGAFQISGKAVQAAAASQPAPAVVSTPQ